MKRSIVPVAMTLLAFALPLVAAEKKLVSTAEKVTEPSIRRQFIQDDYVAIGGHPTKDVFYRERCSVFEKQGTIFMSREFGGKKEIAQMILKSYPEGPDTWEVEFPVAGVRISYLLMYYHDNHPLLVGEVAKKDKLGEYEFSGLETAYPRIYEANQQLKLEEGTPETEPAGADQPATKPADKAPVKDQPSPPTSKDAPPVAGGRPLVWGLG